MTARSFARQGGHEKATGDLPAYGEPRQTQADLKFPKECGRLLRRKATAHDKDRQGGAGRDAEVGRQFTQLKAQIIFIQP